MRWLAITAVLAGCGSPPAAEEPVGFADDLDAPPELAERRQLEPAPPLQGPIARARRPLPPRRIWRGRRIDLDVRNADLTNLYRFLAEVGGINIVIAPDVSGSVTLKLRSVPWDQIAHVVARANNLEIEREGRLWLVRKRK